MRQPCRPPIVAPPSTCETCARGCHCPLDGPSCGHYGCFGSGPRDCPGVAAEEARYAATLAETRARDARDHNRRTRLAATYRLTVVATLGSRA